MTYANWGKRAGACIVDLLPVWILLFIGFITDSFFEYGMFVFLCLAVQVYNRWIQAGKTGQSWGKKALGVKLVRESTGEPVGAGMAFARDIAHIVDSAICYVGWLFPLWDAKAQTIADKIVGTVVVPA